MLRNRPRRLQPVTSYSVHDDTLRERIADLGYSARTLVPDGRPERPANASQSRVQRAQGVCSEHRAE